jgi:hypothetical protein
MTSETLIFAKATVPGAELWLIRLAWRMILATGYWYDAPHPDIL